MARNWQYTMIDQVNVADYITMVIEVYDGDREDPATEIRRYQATYPSNWDGEIELRGSYSLYRPKGSLGWVDLEVVKEKDHDAESYEYAQGNMLNGDRYYSGSGKGRKLYQAFMEAIDVLSGDDENVDAWAAVDEWRQYQALLNEK